MLKNQNDSETKLARLEAPNDKLADTYEQSEEADAARVHWMEKANSQMALSER